MGAPRGSTPVCIRAYKGQTFAVLCRSVRYKDSPCYRCVWLDDSGQLREGTIGVLDALEADPCVFDFDLPLWGALKKRFGMVRNIPEWKEDVAERLKNGEAVVTWPEQL
jgi:hypothetical protein